MAYSKKVVEHYEQPRNVGNFGTTGEVKAQVSEIETRSSAKGRLTCCRSGGRCSYVKYRRIAGSGMRELP